MTSNPKVGVLLTNLGTPDGTGYWDMRRFLGQFLSDRRVIDYHPALWQPLLQGIILSVRPSRSGALYRKIWNTELDESPLLTTTRGQTAAIASRLAEAYGDDVVVDFAMRYGKPSVSSVLQRMLVQGCERILFFPLYPQYSTTTIATANDDLFQAMQQLQYQPQLRTLGSYWREPGYIDALAASITEVYASLPRRPQRLLTSYHGVPQRYTAKGDPYEHECRATSAALAQRLGFPEDELITTFQSKFGPEQWVGPATIEEVARLAEAGITDIAVVSPAFSADCLETLQEVNMEIRRAFAEAGGRDFTYINCLNDRPDHIDVLTGVIKRELGGWL